MTKEDIQHLGRLARIRLSDDEVAAFSDEIDAILAYVSTVQDIAGDSERGVITSPHYNVFRDDVITNQPDEYTDALLQEMPERDGRYLKVKKILEQD